jgi:ComF family protein
MNPSLVSRLKTAVVNPLLDLVYPPRCLGCGEPVHPKDVLCGTCVMDMMELPISAEASAELLASLSYPPDVSFIAAGYDYEKDSIIETCLHSMKYKGMHSTGIWLGRLLGERLHGTAILDGDPILLPVPLNKIKRIERGYNQSEYIARGIAAETGLAIRTDILLRPRYTVSQSMSKLSKEERRTNLEGAFEVDTALAAELRSHPVIIVDDIMTTGATIGECVKALNMAGITDVRIAVVAHPVLR